MGILLECGDIHEIGLDACANLFAKLGEDVEATVIHVCPEVYGNSFGDQAEEMADSWGGIAHEADCCVKRPFDRAQGRVSCFVFRVE